MSRASNLLLRIAIAFSFLYAAYGFWQNPNDWIGYIPPIAQNLGFTQSVLLMLIAGVHLIIALWILSGWRIFLPSVIAAIFLFSVVYFNWNQLDILFRDISIGLAALALALSSRGRF